MHHYRSPLPCLSHFSPIPPPAQTWAVWLQKLFGFLPHQDPELLYIIKSVVNCFSWLPAVLSLMLQKRFWFPTPCHSSTDSIFCFSFSCSLSGTFRWIYKLRWQFAQITGAKFAHVITPIACAIIWTMCTGEQFNLSWSSVGAFLHKQF